MPASIHIPSALWGDIFVAKPGVIGCAYDRDNSVVIEFYRMVGEDQISPAYEDVVVDFDEKVLHVRADTNGREILIMGQAAGSGRFMVNGSNNPQLMTYGTHACDLNTGLDYIVQVSSTEYFDSFDRKLHPIPYEIRGTSNGFIQILNGLPVWADLVRQSIPQMLYPFYTEGVYVGEGAADPPHIQSLEDAVQKNIYNGYAARPRACFDASHNIFAVAARAESGVSFHFFRRPLTDLSIPVVEPPPVIEPPPIVEPPPVIEPPDPEEPDHMACTPVVPPQDVIQRSTESLRSFCQNYEFNGQKPYVNDEIHENGLFIADGLIYFMMSDTGNWAKILMNPDDKRPWEEKRVAADLALQNYMKARVGDAPKSVAPGGSLSGEVNV